MQNVSLPKTKNVLSKDEFGENGNSHSDSFVKTVCLGPN